MQFFFIYFAASRRLEQVSLSSMARCRIKVVHVGVGVHELDRLVLGRPAASLVHVHVYLYMYYHYIQ